MAESRGAQDTYLLIPILLLAVLASIAVIRTFLSYFLERDITEASAPNAPRPFMTPDPARPS